MPKIDELVERVERLLLRHEELRRTVELQNSRLAGLTEERDRLQARLNAARGRIDALLERVSFEPARIPGDADGGIDR